MSRNKWGEIFAAPETTQARESIQQAFEAGGTGCFDTLQKISPENKRQWPKKLREASSAQDFNQLFNRQHPHDPFSSRLDQQAPQRYSDYKLVEKPLIQYEIKLCDDQEYEALKTNEPTKESVIYCRKHPDRVQQSLQILVANGSKNLAGKSQFTEASIPFSEISTQPMRNIQQRDLNDALPKLLAITSSQGLTRPYHSDHTYLHLDMKTNENEATLTYSIKNPNQAIKRDQFPLGNCVLIQWDDDPVDDMGNAVIKAIPAHHQAIIRTNDGSLYWFHEKKIEKITPNKETKSQYDDISNVINALPAKMVPQTASKNQRESVSALLSQPGKEPITFEIDEVAAGLASSRQNQYDGKLDTVITHVQRSDPHAGEDAETYDQETLRKMPLGPDFLNLLNAGGSSISHVLSNEERFRYYLAYQQAMSQPSKSQQLKVAFAKEMNQKILKDTIADLDDLLEQKPPQYPQETLDLAYTLMDKIRSNDNKKQQILDLRMLRQFLNTSWAKGTALTEGAVTNPVSDAEKTVGPYVTQTVEERQSLAIDEKMPNYAAYKSLFQQFNKQVLQYNAKVDVSQARAAIKTRFYLPENKAEYERLKQTKRNCFILYENQLYHINSDKTLIKLPAIDDLVGKKIQLKSPPLSSSDKKALDDEERLLIHHARTNTYTIGYTKDGKYAEKSLNDLLGEQVPFDPNVTLAQETLDRALQGTSYFSYLQAIRGQMPRFGKIFSYTNRGRLNVHLGYQFAEWDPNTPMEKGTIYISTDKRGVLCYSIITPNQEKILEVPLKNQGDINELLIDKSAQEAIVNEIADHGHAYKVSYVPIVYDPNTMAAKSKTEAGYQDSMKKYRIARENRFATWRAFTEDKAAMGDLTEARREAILLSTRIARGELTDNQRLNKRECGMERYVTNRPADLCHDAAFLQHCQGKGQDMYYLHTLSSTKQPMALYFVDRSHDKPVVIKVEAKETPREKSARENQDGLWGMVAGATNKFSLSRATLKADQREFYQNLDRMLRAVGQPEDVKDRTESWAKLGLEHTAAGSVVRYAAYTQDDLEDSDLVNEIMHNIQLGVEERNEVWMVDHPDGYQIYYIGERDQKIYCESFDKNDQQMKSMMGALSSSPLTDDKRKELNALLSAKGISARIPSRQAKISVISPELDEAINAETKDVRLKAKAYHDQLDKYAYHEISNQLSYVLAQRRELEARYQDRQTKAYKTALIDQSSDATVLNKPLTATDKFRPNEQKIYFDPQTKLFTKYTEYTEGSEKKIKAESFKDLQLGLSPLTPSDTCHLNQAILAEQYQIKYLDKDTYEKLIAWMKDYQGEPPISIERGLLYVYHDKEKHQFDCLSRGLSRKLTAIGLQDSAKLEAAVTEKDQLNILLPLTERAGITLPAHLVDANFLQRCEEAQRFLEHVGNKAYERIVSTESILPQAKREKLLTMMTEIATDPTSRAAAHYLRKHHQMYITTGMPESPDPGDKQPPSFYLDVTNPKQPKLYRFEMDAHGEYVVNERGKYRVMPVKLEAYYTSTPEKELYNIAQKSLGKDFDHGKVVDLSCSDVYYHITNQSAEALKMDTALEMIEEIYQAELGVAKFIENMAFAVLAAAVGVGMIMMGNPAGSIPVIGAILALIAGPLLAGLTGLAFLASFSCARAAIVHNGWFDGGLSELKQKISALDALVVQQNSQHSRGQAPQGLRGFVGNLNEKEEQTLSRSVRVGSDSDSDFGSDFDANHSNHSGSSGSYFENDSEDGKSDDDSDSHTINPNSGSGKSF